MSKNEDKLMIALENFINWVHTNKKNRDTFIKLANEYIENEDKEYIDNLFSA